MRAAGAQDDSRRCVPYWGKYAYHDNNRDINLVLMQMRALGDWYFTAHPPIMHDLHESLPLLYTYSGGAPQNPNLDPLLFTELPWFANWELVADDALRHAGRVHPRVHGRLVAGVSGIAGVQSQRHDEDVRDEFGAGPRLGSDRRHPESPKPKPDSAKKDSTGKATPAATTPAAATVDHRAPAARCRPDAAAGRTASGTAAFRSAPKDSALYTRRANTNYMQTGVHLGAAARGDVPADRAGEFLHPDPEQHRGRAAPSRRTGT